MIEENTEEIGIDANSLNSFYYTMDNRLKKLDDKIILAKITEKYPEFRLDTPEKILKNVIFAIFNDSKFISEIVEYFDMTLNELFIVIYRHYSYMFNTCLIKKIKESIKRKPYVRKFAKESRRTGKKRIVEPVKSKRKK